MARNKATQPSKITVFRPNYGQGASALFPNPQRPPPCPHNGESRLSVSPCFVDLRGSCLGISTAHKQVIPGHPDQ
jgi:hypothetical protein